MKNKKSHFLQISATVFTFTFAFLLATTGINAAISDDKLKTEDIITKHLESIGTTEARQAVKTMMATGTVKAVSRGQNGGTTEGLLIMISEAEKNLIGMRFTLPEYPYEKMGFDGSAFTVAYIKPGQRSVLGNFMLDNENTFENGILGGVLSTSWELLNYNEKVGKLKCGGDKNVDGVRAYKCRYNPKRSALTINFYFDATNFRHIKTEYDRTISAGQGLSVDNSARQQETRYKLTEEFSDFKEVNNLTLPHKYTLSYEARENRGPTTFDWNMEVTNFTFNEPIDVKNFKADTL